MGARGCTATVATRTRAVAVAIIRVWAPSSRMNAPISSSGTRRMRLMGRSITAGTANRTPTIAYGRSRRRAPSTIAAQPLQRPAGAPAATAPGRGGEGAPAAGGGPGCYGRGLGRNSGSEAFGGRSNRGHPQECGRNQDRVLPDPGEDDGGEETDERPADYAAERDR